MFDSIFNFILILIPLAIFIGRIVLRASNKQAPRKNAPRKNASQKALQNAPPPRPRISVHFEDDVESTKPLAKKTAYEADAKAQHVFSAGTKLMPKPLKKPDSVVRDQALAVAGQKGFPLKLNQLSPMKQAVVMAEVLGPPKGMI
jgi:hypothetical protein